MRRPVRFLTAYALLGANVLVGNGCDDPPLECAEQLRREVQAFEGAAFALAETTHDLRVAMAFSCAMLAGELGVDNPPIVADPSEVEDASVVAACELARMALEETMAKTPPLQVTIEDASCDYASAAQIVCEERCSLGACEAGTVEQRCDPALTKGVCSGDCSGTCIMQSGSVACAGNCDGTCQGACSGACGMDCIGACEGTCSGRCYGTCDAVPPGEICGGQCLGGCSAPYEEPTCQAAIAETTCEISEPCAEACEAHAYLGAACDPVLRVEGNDAMKAILEAHATPIFAAARIRGRNTIDRANFIAEEGYVRAHAAVYQAGCVAQMGVHLLPTFDTARENVLSLLVMVDEAEQIVALIDRP